MYSNAFPLASSKQTRIDHWKLPNAVGSSWPYASCDPKNSRAVMNMQFGNNSAGTGNHRRPNREAPPDCHSRDMKTRVVRHRNGTRSDQTRPSVRCVPQLLDRIDTHTTEPCD